MTNLPLRSASPTVGDRADQEVAQCSAGSCLNTGGYSSPGALFVEVSRYPYSRTEIEVQVIVTEVSATLDGTPLNDTGRPIR